MTYSQLVQLYFDRSNALQWYWTLYVVIVGGLLAFSSLRARQDLITLLLITVLFSFFAYKNCGAIHDVTMQRIATVQAINDIHAIDKAAAAHNEPTSGTMQVHELLGPTLITPDWEGVRNFHILSDVLTIAALWAFELRRVKQAKELRKTAAPPQSI